MEAAEHESAFVSFNSYAGSLTCHFLFAPPWPRKCAMTLPPPVAIRQVSRPNLLPTRREDEVEKMPLWQALPLTKFRAPRPVLRPWVR